ncbi:GNAT family N-acetyltransferase [Pontibacter silvestris]|uniref:GNAT family N-acetyltransferase n=1 Tax=Pontibacter silvestris TaxID=2305183 RepID=A0ABW4X083_9BACT|nr:GNAT family N-acetyltransferase [Pontibacter silvestris]MCC9135474.1 GNAT family N-acetyltransferase [Pontibacter silvestris]
MSNINIVPCSPDSLSQLKQISIQAYKDHYLYLWHDEGEWYLNFSFSEQALRKELTDPNAAFFQIYDEGKLVGFLKLNINKALENYSEEECLELERIYLVKHASGRGIGSKLIEFTVSFARERNKKLVWLKAIDRSRSVSFYEQNGFNKCGTYTLEFTQMKEEFRGMYIMKREL